MKKILVIDGQGGGVGNKIIKSLKEKFNDLYILAIGINSIATSNMLKAGPNNIATGENAIVVNSLKTDIIIGPIGIIIKDSLLGEVTSKISEAIASSNATKVLIPFNNCNTLISGVNNSSINELIEDAIKKVDELLKK